MVEEETSGQKAMEHIKNLLKYIVQMSATAFVLAMVLLSAFSHGPSNEFRQLAVLNGLM